MKKRVYDQRNTKLSLAAGQAAQTAEHPGKILEAVGEILGSLGLKLREGSKLMVQEDQTKPVQIVVPPENASDSGEVKTSTGEPAEPPNQQIPPEAGGNSTAGVISEGELFDEFIDGNVSNSVVYAHYERSGNLNIHFNITINSGSTTSSPASE
jgi:hypothetical protein